MDMPLRPPPTTQPCDRQFGLACRARCFPHRCSGLNPATMFREYAAQSRRLAVLRQYRAILVASAHGALFEWVFEKVLRSENVPPQNQSRP